MSAIHASRRLLLDGRTALRSVRFVAALTVETLTRSVDAGSRRNALQALAADRLGGDANALSGRRGAGSASTSG